MEKTTSRKVKVVGKEEYIRAATGEIEEFQVVKISDVDANFSKIWLGHILSLIEEIGNAKMKVLSYLLEHRQPATNMVTKTIREIAKASNVSLDTVHRTLNALEKHGIVVRKTGVVFLNPNVIFRGTHGSRMKVLFEYTKMAIDQNGTKTEDQEDQKDENAA